MSDYSNTFGGAAKDAANDTILAADHDTQYDAIATMSATKANKVSSATNNNIATTDANGDLKDGGVTINEVKEAVWPVGSIFMSTVSTNPNTLIGIGTWTQTAQGRCLIGEGTGAGLTARTAGTEGGVEDAIVPQHNHDITDPGHTHTISSNEENSAVGTRNSCNTRAHANNVTTNSTTTGITIDNAGEDATDKNMQPYLVVYIWERTA